MARTVHFMHDSCSDVCSQHNVRNHSNKRKAQSESAEHFIATANEHLEGFDLLRSFHLTEASRVAMSSANQAWEKQKFGARYFSSLARLLSFTVGQIIYIGIISLEPFLPLMD